MGATHVALLRAINVGGRSMVKMSDLRALFESLGLRDVATYIQTGNVLFTTGARAGERLTRRIERRVESSLGHPVTVFVLSAAQLREAAARNPLEPARLDGERHCHLMFLSGEPDPARRVALKARERDGYRFHLDGTTLYYSYPRATARSRRSIDFEKVLGVRGTARTWKVVDRLIQLTAA